MNISQLSTILSNNQVDIPLELLKQYIPDTFNLNDITYNKYQHPSPGVHSSNINKIFNKSTNNRYKNVNSKPTNIDNLYNDLMNAKNNISTNNSSSNYNTHNSSTPNNAKNNINGDFSCFNNFFNDFPNNSTKTNNANNANKNSKYTKNNLNSSNNLNGPNNLNGSNSSNNLNSKSNKFTGNNSKTISNEFHTIGILHESIKSNERLLFDNKFYTVNFSTKNTMCLSILIALDASLIQLSAQKAADKVHEIYKSVFFNMTKDNNYTLYKYNKKRCFRQIDLQRTFLNPEFDIDSDYRYVKCICDFFNINVIIFNIRNNILENMCCVSPYLNQDVPSVFLYCENSKYGIITNDDYIFARDNIHIKNIFNNIISTFDVDIHFMGVFIQMNIEKKTKSKSNTKSKQCNAKSKINNSQSLSDIINEKVENIIVASKLNDNMSSSIINKNVLDIIDATTSICKQDSSENIVSDNETDSCTDVDDTDDETDSDTDDETDSATYNIADSNTDNVLGSDSDDITDSDTDVIAENDTDDLAYSDIDCMDESKAEELMNKVSSIVLNAINNASNASNIFSNVDNIDNVDNVDKNITKYELKKLNKCNYNELVSLSEENNIIIIKKSEKSGNNIKKTKNDLINELIAIKVK